MGKTFWGEGFMVSVPLPLSFPAPPLPLNCRCWANEDGVGCTWGRTGLTGDFLHFTFSALSGCALVPPKTHGFNGF